MFKKPGEGNRDWGEEGGGGGGLDTLWFVQRPGFSFCYFGMKRAHFELYFAPK